MHYGACLCGHTTCHGLGIGTGESKSCRRASSRAALSEMLDMDFRENVFFSEVRIGVREVPSLMAVWKGLFPLRAGKKRERGKEACRVREGECIRGFSRPDR
jgi:hypothetical protein